MRSTAITDFALRTSQYEWMTNQAYTYLEEYFVALFSRSSIAVSYLSTITNVVLSALALTISESGEGRSDEPRTRREQSFVLTYCSA